MKIKIIALLLTLSVLLPCAISCANNDKKNDQTENEQAKVIDSEYVIIRADNSDELTTKSAALLANLINEKASVSVSINTDSLEKSSEKEIILGSTNRKTEFDRTTLQPDQYYVGVEGSRVIIDAYDSLTLYLAVSKVVDSWLTLGGGTFTLDKSVISSLGSSIDTESKKIKIMSQNMRYTDDPNGNSITERAPRFLQLVEMYQPDIIGTQETTIRWNDYFRKSFKDIYGMVGCSREGRDAFTGEWSTILYRLDRFELLDSDTFWLSKTPQTVSKVSGSQCYRICTWALLKDKNTGETFVMANTHLDHSTDQIRSEQLVYLFNGLSDLMEQYPIYLTGDFNASPNSNAYNKAAEKFIDSHVEALENRSDISHTFDSYGSHNGSRIDYCFYNDRSIAIWYKILNEQFGGYVSDHYGIITEFIIK